MTTSDDNEFARYLASYLAERAVLYIVYSDVDSYYDAYLDRQALENGIKEFLETLP